jgi:hypothetical protein
VRNFEKVIRSGIWEIPDKAFQMIPLYMIEILNAVHPATQEDGSPHPKSGKYVYATRARQSAARIIAQLVGQNLHQVPTEQHVTGEVKFSGDMEATKRALAGLTAEQLQKLAAAGDVLDSLDSE